MIASTRKTAIAPAWVRTLAVKDLTCRAKVAATTAKATPSRRSVAASILVAAMATGFAHGSIPSDEDGTGAESAPPHILSSVLDRSTADPTSTTGFRLKLEELGFHPAGCYTFDGASVLSGGVRRRSVARGLLDLNLTFDPKPLFGVEGGALFVQYYYRHGRFGGDDVGDAQGYSNQDADRLNQMEEIWYEQKLWSDQLRVKLGQIDANAEFGMVEAAGEFISSNAGFSPTIVGLPTYPDPALGLNAFAHPTEQLYIGAGVYADNFRNLSSESFRHPFVIGEIGVTHSGRGTLGPGRLALGAWWNSDDLDRFDGGIAHGTSGFFLVGEQQAWRENPDSTDDTQGVSVFAQYGWADQAVSPFAQHLAVGVAINGLIPSRDADTTGVRWSWVDLSRKPGSGFDANEDSLELFHHLQLTPAYSVKPGLQWIRHPGGQATAGDALVATLRIAVNL